MQEPNHGGTKLRALNRDNVTDCPKELISSINQQCMQWIISEGLPFSTTASPQFRQFVGDPLTGLLPGYIPPQQNALSSMLDTDFKLFADNVKTVLQLCWDSCKHQPFLTLLHDTCTFANKTTYVGASLVFITPSWQKFLIATTFEPLTESKTADAGAATITSDFESTYGLQLQPMLLSIVSDTATSALATSRSLFHSNTARFDVTGRMEENSFLEAEPENCVMHTADLVMSYACFQERVFSTAKMCMGTKRTRMNHDVFKKAALLQHNSKFIDTNKHAKFS